MTRPSSNATRSKSHRAPGPSDEKGGEPTYDWAALVPRVLHPLKVAIIEALLWIGIPLSASDLNKVLDKRFGVGLVSYHLKCLAKLGALKQHHSRRVRGAIERFYFFPRQLARDDHGPTAA